MARSLNKVQLIGNLTRDPELRYTPQGTAVCPFGLATNRTWVTEAGEKKEEAEFHRIVAWNKLAELCAQLLFKGRKVFVEGRIQTRQWTAADGTPRQTTEIVISDMIILDSRRAPGEEVAVEGAVSPEAAVTPEGTPAVEETPGPTAGEPPAQPVSTGDDKKTKKKGKGKEPEETPSEEVKPEDIPF